jgi:hypothetical protein
MRDFPTDQRGVALPMAMLVLLILSIVMIGFSVLGATEPTIANNQLMTTQARALAEAGVERAIWALNNPTEPKGVPSGGPIAPPYDGSQIIPVSVGVNTQGGFRVTVTDGASAAERVITSVGWVPNDTTSNPKAHQKITVVVINPQLVFRDPPAALAVRGDLQAGGNSLVDSRADASCGRKVGTLTTGATSLRGTTTDIRGATDNNDVRNEVTSAHNGPLPADAHDIVTNLATSAFDQFTWTDADINSLRVYAKAHGTYLRGKVDFNASNQMPNGLIFVDTVSGSPITLEGVTPATPTADFANVTIHDAAAGDPLGIVSGWLFVNGSLSVNGNLRMRGVIYTQNDLSYHGIGAGGVSGTVISRNVGGTSSTSIDSDPLGNTAIVYNCIDARTGGGAIPYKWTIKSGTYREFCDSCT